MTKVIDGRRLMVGWKIKLLGKRGKLIGQGHLSQDRSRQYTFSIIAKVTVTRSSSRLTVQQASLAKKDAARYNGKPSRELTNPSDDSRDDTEPCMAPAIHYFRPTGLWSKMPAQLHSLAGRALVYMQDQMERFVASDSKAGLTICGVVAFCAIFLFFKGSGVLELFRDAEGLSAIGSGLWLWVRFERRRHNTAKRESRSTRPDGDSDK
jgi:hypothetical protein